jgi:hypothetical protein
VSFDRTNICEARYLYRNLINSNGIIEHNEIDDNDGADVDIETCDTAKDLIEKYILENPDFLDNAIV